MSRAGITALAVAAGAPWWLWMLRVQLVAARMLQIEEYETDRLWRWSRQRPWLLHPTVIMGFGCGAAAVGASLVAGVAAVACWAVVGIAGVWRWRWVAPKKPLVHTPRMRRLLALSLVMTATVALILAALIAVYPVVGGVGVLVACSTVPTVAVASLSLSNRMLTPVEATIRRGFLRRATRRVRSIDPAIVAVAGSYGKTSTKHIVTAMLNASVPTVMTPKSFNTLMGVCRTVHENLEPGHRIFVVEMDTYGAGEIRDICRLTPPVVSVVTSVGPQHLERFGSVERIADAIYEVVEALGPAGTAVIYAGEPSTATLVDRARAAGQRVVSYGIEGDSSDLDVVAATPVVEENGVRFTWRWQNRGLERTVRVPLLGRHSVLNATAALIVVELLGHSVERAAEVAQALEPVPHRLQPIPTATGIRIIDDAYNANPVGVHNGLDVLAACGGGARILVTPGMVELGELEAPENRRYGEHAARVCDHVIVVASRPGREVLVGLRTGGMDDARVHVVDDVAGATEVLRHLAQPGDTVLFANDLPDTYSMVSVARS